jgi:spermidine/putrescine transport system substrate-binding protein
MGKGDSSSTVTWKVYPENPAIASDLPIERDGSPQIFNWDSYVAPSLLRRFERDLGVRVEVSTFYDMNEAISKLRVGAVRPDIFFPTLDALGRLIVAGLVQPLNSSYLLNFPHVWSELQSPFYDVGSQYTVPYTVYSTGIGWRTDLVHDDIATMDNPWSVFGGESYQAPYKGEIYLLDDYREALGMVLLEQGIQDINTEDASQITDAAERLIDVGRRVDIKWSLSSTASSCRCT